MAIMARILQWPSVHVMPLLRAKSLRGAELAEQIAHRLAEVGTLRVVERDEDPPFGVYVRLRVVPYDQREILGKKGRGVWINLRPAHFQGRFCVVPKPHEINLLEFLFVKNRRGRHRDDPTSYLEIKPRSR